MYCCSCFSLKIVEYFSFVAYFSALPPEFRSIMFLTAAALWWERVSESTATRTLKERSAQQRVLNYLFTCLGPFAFPLSCFLVKFASCFCICKRHRFFK